VQYPSAHFPLVPHCASVTHVPHVPVTHAMPPPHWLLAVHAEQTPLMHASPIGACGLPKGCVLQSRNVEHGPHTPFTQACPAGQPIRKLQPCVVPDGVQIPEAHDSPDAQSPSTVHVHCIPECVAAHFALGPHWLSDVHVTHFWPAHTSPGLHWLLDVQVWQPPVHSTQTSRGWHMAMPPGTQYSPIRHWALEVHWPGPGMTAQLHCWPAGHVEHCAQTPLWHVVHAGQSLSPWHFETHAADAPGRTLQTSGGVQVTLPQLGGGGGGPSSVDGASSVASNIPESFPGIVWGTHAPVA
jgi:hypothetical protein